MIINMIGGGSGGAALNFDVVRYATKSELLAATPKENTIGIISTTEMTGWIIDANQPEELTEGMVWISVGTSSAVEFNALKKNGLLVYPLSAKQYVSGAWVDKTAMIHQNGEWVGWETYIVKSGVLSSGFNLSGSLRSTQHFEISQQSGYLRVYDTYGYYGGRAISGGLDVTNISKLVLVCKIINAGEPNQLGCGLGLAKALNATNAGAVIENVVASQMRTVPGAYTLELNVETYSGVYYPCIWSTSTSSSKADVYIYDFYYLVG